VQPLHFIISDKGLVKTAIEATKLYNNLVTGQLSVILDEISKGQGV
jgi:hypothetical protein